MVNVRLFRLVLLWSAVSVLSILYYLFVPLLFALVFPHHPCQGLASVCRRGETAETLRLSFAGVKFFGQLSRSRPYSAAYRGFHGSFLGVIALSVSYDLAENTQPCAMYCACAGLPPNRWSGGRSDRACYCAVPTIRTAGKVSGSASLDTSI